MEHQTSPQAARALRVDEFIERYRIGTSSFWKYQRMGAIRIIRIGKRVIIPPSEVERIDAEGITPISKAEEKRRLQSAA